VPNNTRLGIPALNLEDGPQGVADGVTLVTAWPSALTVVQSWDADAMFEYGRAMGQEQYLKGTNVMLGPAINQARVPWGGRTFEYTGEDPFLASVLVKAEIQGIQANNISGCIKHFVGGSTAHDRRAAANTELQQMRDRHQGATSHSSYSPPPFFPSHPL
jgi:beta-glucosidase